MEITKDFIGTSEIMEKIAALFNVRYHYKKEQLDDNFYKFNVTLRYGNETILPKSNKLSTLLKALINQEPHTKYLLINLKQIHGEYTFRTMHVLEVDVEPKVEEFDIDLILNKYIKSYYNENKAEKDDKFAYYCNNGEIYVSGEIKEISEHEYKIFKKYT